MNTELCKIEEKAQRAIEAYAMLPENELVVVGLSGGADSVALTHFLWRLQAARRFTLQAAHLNHGPVSYTHLDVYKRQGISMSGARSKQGLRTAFPDCCMTVPDAAP